ncbi:MAG: hypothetical protein AAGK05_07440, partial [Pseudomonadota bacterium]
VHTESNNLQISMSPTEINLPTHARDVCALTAASHSVHTESNNLQISMSPTEINLPTHARDAFELLMLPANQNTNQ